MYTLDTMHVALSYVYLIQMDGSHQGALQLHAVYEKPYSYYKSCENPYQILQISISAASHPRIRIRYFNSCTLHLSVQWFVWENHYHHSTKLVCCCWHCNSCCALITVQMATELWSYQLSGVRIRNWNMYDRYVSNVTIWGMYSCSVSTSSQSCKDK